MMERNTSQSKSPSQNSKKKRFLLRALFFVVVGIVIGVVFSVQIISNKLSRHGLSHLLFNLPEGVATVPINLYLYDIEGARFDEVPAAIRKTEDPSLQINQIIKTCCDKLEIRCPEFVVFIENDCVTLVPRLRAGSRSGQPVFDLGSIADEIVAEKSLIKTLTAALHGSSDFFLAGRDGSGTRPSSGALRIGFLRSEPKQRIWRHLDPAQCH